MSPITSKVLARRRLVAAAALTTIASLATMFALLCAVGWAIAARPGEWSVPLRVGGDRFGVRIDASVAALLRLGTHPLGLRMIDGRTFASRFGTLRFTRLDRDRLAIACGPCRLQLPALGASPLAVDSVVVTVLQRADRVDGTIAVGDTIAGRYAGRFDAERMTLDVVLDRASIAAYYAVFGDAIPETRVADIRGTVSFAATVTMPSMRIKVRPRIENFAVAGLGTERLRGRLPSSACVRGGVRPLDPGAWLPRAVVAAEDQRYAEHPGYDLDEVVAAFADNQSAGQVAHGASTIPQQLAKLLFVGSERSVARKLRELLYAVEMEDTLGKARMLQLYLAVAPWGEGRCGAEAAARHYFGVPASRLGAAQAVWLAAMLHGPDREAARWSAAGGIDLARARWVASGLRGLRAGARLRLAEELTAMAPPTAIVAGATIARLDPSR